MDPVLRDLWSFLEKHQPDLLNKFKARNNPATTDSPASPENDMEVSSEASSAAPTDSSSDTGSDEEFTRVVSKKTRKRKVKSPLPAPAETGSQKRQATGLTKPTLPSTPKTAPAPTSAPAPPAPSGQEPGVEKIKTPPPIYLRDKAAWNHVSRAITDQKIAYSHARSTAVGIKITVPTPGDHRRLTTFLRSKSFEYHTYALEDERHLRVVIRGIPREITPEQIIGDLKSQNIPVIDVHRMYNHLTKKPYELVLVIIELTPAGKKVFDLRTITGLSGIKIETPRNKGIPGQCHRCQMYGHSARNCHARPRCVKCLGDHETIDCPRPKKADIANGAPLEPPACVNCGTTGHPANYRGCPKAPRKHTRGPTRAAAPQAQRSTHKQVAAPPQALLPAPVPRVNAWSKPPSMVKPQQAPQTKSVRPVPPPSCKPVTPATQPAPQASKTKAQKSIGDKSADFAFLLQIASEIDPDRVSALADEIRAAPIHEQILIIGRNADVFKAFRRFNNRH